ncbi:MAG: HEAT repeat domain-containing protein [Synechococcales cyanobacterium RU_4_20]|nr:HEAT repeat domain-containing protein [Synechococcales cyanobacterium RU_4_20]
MHDENAILNPTNSADPDGPFDGSDVLDPVDALDNPLDDIDPLEHIPEAEPQADPEEMLSWLQSSDRQQKMAAARAFCQLEDPRATPLLIEYLSDTCPLMRVSAAYGLGRNPSPAAVEPLIRQLEDWNGYVRKGVVWAWAIVRSPLCPPPPRRPQTDIAAVRLWAASSLGQMSAIDYEAMISAIPPLIGALRQDAIAVVRSNCAWSLGQLCQDLPSNVVYATAIDALIETLVEDEDMSVREDAKASLLRVGDPSAVQMIEVLQQDGLLW